MLEKTIKNVLRKKLNEWISSVDDEVLRRRLVNNVVVTGGCFTSLMQNEEPKDFDLYLRDKETCIAVAEYYVKQFNSDYNHKVGEVREKENGSIQIFVSSSGVAGQLESNDIEDMELGEDPLDHMEDDKRRKYQAVFLSENAITLSEKVQIVTRFYGTPDEVHETFDFVHTKAYFTNWNEEISIPKDVYEAVMNKNLVYTGSKYPLCSIIRMRKFIQRGWHINAGQILKMCMQLNDLDLKDIEVLKDQLTGVDSLYFSWLIDALERRQAIGEEIDSMYIVELVDKLF